MSRLPQNINTKILEQLAVTIAAQYDRDQSHHSKVQAIKEMLTKDEVTSLAYETTCLMITAMIGPYVNINLAIEEECRDSLAQLKGTLIAKVLDACSFLPYGFSWAQIVYKVRGGKATLKDVEFLDQERLRFEGSTRSPKLFYRGVSKEISLEYSQGWHLKNQSNISTSGSPTGFRLGDRALPEWELHQTLFSSYAVVAQKQATKLLVIKTDTTEVDSGTVDLETGEPILEPGGKDMQMAAEKTENSSILIVDVDDEVEAIDQASDGRFFIEGLTRSDNKRFRCFYLPQTAYGGNASGVGDAGLAYTQSKSLLLIMASKANYIASEFVEQVLRPMIEFNHGAQPDYGSFQINAETPTVVEIATLLSLALQHSMFEEDPDLARSARLKLAQYTGIV